MWEDKFAFTVVSNSVFQSQHVWHATGSVSASQFLSTTLGSLGTHVLSLAQRNPLSASTESEVATAPSESQRQGEDVESRLWFNITDEV